MKPDSLALARRLGREPLSRGSLIATLIGTLRSESGQALSEQSILLATLVGALAVGGVWLMKSHPDAMNAINIWVRGFYFVLSLPIP